MKVKIEEILLRKT